MSRELWLALAMGLGLLVGLVAREYAKAWAADRMGLHVARLHGRLTLDPRRYADPIGTLILPGLLLFIVATGQGPLPAFAYAKPLPVSPDHLRDPRRDLLTLAFAGPAANLVLAAIGGLLGRVLLATDAGGMGSVLVFGFVWANLVMCVFHLMPIPGLDGSLWLRRLLQGRARETYANLDPYLPLFMLAIFFLLGSPVLGFVQAIASWLCRVAVPGTCF